MGKYAALDAAQFTVKGYGETKPLAPNSTTANRAKNRRVEFTVLNKEVLKKEVERRRLLKKARPPRPTRPSRRRARGGARRAGERSPARPSSRRGTRGVPAGPSGGAGNPGTTLRA